jgi:hypothetical protein
MLQPAQRYREGNQSSQFFVTKTNYKPIKIYFMTYNAFYSIYDEQGRYVGFTDTLEDAKLMTNEYNGHYELEFVYVRDSRSFGDKHLYSQLLKVPYS